MNSKTSKGTLLLTCQTVSFHQHTCTNRELRELNLHRLDEFESRLTAKDAEIETLREKYAKLKGDFAYNLKLLEERDAELERYDHAFAQLKDMIREKDREISEIRVSVADAEATARQERNRATEGEQHLTAKIAELHKTIESTKWQREDDLRRQREVCMNLNHNAQ